MLDLVPTPRSTINIAQDEWTKFSPELIADMRTGIKTRHQGKSFAALTLTALAHTHGVLSGLLPTETADEVITRSRKMQQQWADWVAKYEDDCRNFKRVCAQKRANQDQELLHDLAESRKVAAIAAKAAEAHSKHFIQTHQGNDALTSAASRVSNFLEEVCVLEASKSQGQPLAARNSKAVPVLVIWDLNALPNSDVLDPSGKCSERVHAIIAMLTAFPGYSMAVVIHKRSAPSGGMSRRGFHDALSRYMERCGLDCDMDLALNYKSVARQKTPLIVPAYLMFLRGTRQTSIFNFSDLIKGSLIDLQPASYKDMVDVGPDGGDSSARQGSNLSAHKRLQFLPVNTFTSIFEATFSTLKGPCAPLLPIKIISFHLLHTTYHLHVAATCCPWPIWEDGPRVGVSCCACPVVHCGCASPWQRTK